jgi:hypothetical protein
MNKRLKELAVQAGLEEHPVHGDWSSLNYPDVRGADLERFADLVRQDLYQVTGKSVIEQINSAIQIEREACARLVEEFEPESFYLGQLKNTAAAIRARSEK